MVQKAWMQMNDPNKKKDFDPDFSPGHEINQEAAEDRGLTYDPERRQYVDDEGYVTHDEFGQPL